MSVDKFMAIFDGLKEAHGYFKIENTGANGKAKGKAGVLREPRTKNLFVSQAIIIKFNQYICPIGQFADRFPADPGRGRGG